MPFYVPNRRRRLIVLGLLNVGNVVELGTRLPSTSTLVPQVRVLDAAGVEVVDEDGDATTYEWYLNGSLVQSGADSTYAYTASTTTPDTVLIRAHDGALADSETWLIDVDVSTEVAEAVPATAGPALRASPNPFNPAVTVRFALPARGSARVTVHDAGGRLVEVLHEGPARAGESSVVWRGKDRSGADAASGIYFVRLEAAGTIQSRKIVLLR